jgi:hypothetical protein
LNKEISEKQQMCKVLEDEIVQLKGKLEKEDIKSKFENNSKILNNIISSHKSSNDKIGLGYSPSTEQEYDKIGYAYVLKKPINRKQNKTRSIPFETIPNKHKYAPYTNEKDNEKNRIIRRNPSKKKPIYLLGYCYSCKRIGHKVIHCKSYREYNPRNVQRYGSNKDNAKGRNYNSLPPL